MDVFTTRQVEELRNELLAAAVNCTFVADENCTPGTPLCSAKSRSSVDFARALRSAIRVPRYARGNNVQKRDATLSGEDLDPCLGKDGHQGGPGCTWTKTC